LKNDSLTFPFQNLLLELFQFRIINFKIFLEGWSLDENMTIFLLKNLFFFASQKGHFSLANFEKVEARTPSHSKKNDSNRFFAYEMKKLHLQNWNKFHVYEIRLIQIYLSLNLKIRPSLPLIINKYHFSENLKSSQTKSFSFISRRGAHFIYLLWIIF